MAKRKIFIIISVYLFLGLVVSIYYVNRSVKNSFENYKNKLIAESKRIAWPIFDFVERSTRWKNDFNGSLENHDDFLGSWINKPQKEKDDVFVSASIGKDNTIVSSSEYGKNGTVYQQGFQYYPEVQRFIHETTHKLGKNEFSIVSEFNDFNYIVIQNNIIRKTVITSILVVFAGLLVLLMVLFWLQNVSHALKTGDLEKLWSFAPLSLEIHTIFHRLNKIEKQDTEVSETKHVNKGSRLLIVEDDKELNFEMKTLLSVDFDVVNSCHSTDSAFLAIEELEPDIIVFDCQLGSNKIGGIQFFQAAKKKFSNVTGICVSGYPSSFLVSHAFDAGAVSYLKKMDFNPIDLPKIIKDAQAGNTFVSAKASERYRELVNLRKNFTNKQLNVLAAKAFFDDDKEICNALDMTPSAVTTMLSNIKRKFSSSDDYITSLTKL